MRSSGVTFCRTAFVGVESLQLLKYIYSMFGEGREYKASVCNFSLLKSQTFLLLVTARGNIIKQTINQTTELHYSDIKNAKLALGNCLYCCLYICLFT